MSDQKRWFKLWHSALSDDGLSALNPALRWAWAALGAHIKVHGVRGTATISIKNQVLAAQLGVTVDAMFDTINMLPHVYVNCKKLDNGEITVTFENWYKYQEDSTVSERVSRLRSKRRGEKEEKKKKEDILPLPSFSVPKPEEVKAYAESVGFVLDPQSFCDYYEARGWQYRTGQKMKDWKAAVRTWKKNGGNYASTVGRIGRDSGPQAAPGKYENIEKRGPPKLA